MSVRITVERPGEREIHRLFKKYGRPVTREIRFDLRERKERKDYPECKGGTRIAIRMGNGIVMVKASSGERYGLPGGRIAINESIEEGAIREAVEETGLEVRLKELPEMHKCQYLFKGWNLERWVFIFVAETAGGNLSPRDQKEVSEVAVWEDLPVYYGEDHWLRTIWNEHFRT